jgi:peroxidase
VWGQFIDHDVVLTPSAAIESVPIPLPANEPLFTQPIPFERSEVFAGTGVSKPREQINLNTAWIDASMVYGSEESVALWLRTRVDGKLKTSTGNFLPWNTIDGQRSSAIDPKAPSMANDGNFNQTVVLLL